MRVRSNFDDVSPVNFTMLSDALRVGWCWWIAELRAIAPIARLQAPGATHDAVLIRPRQHETELERPHGDVVQSFIDPRPLSELDEAAWNEIAGLVGDRALHVVLEAPACYDLSLRMPRAAGMRLRQAVELQLLERAPLMLDHLRWNMSPPRREGEYLHVDVAMVDADRVGALGGLFADHGFASPSISAATTSGEIMIEDRRQTSGLRQWRDQAVAAALLCSIPISTIVIASAFSWMDERATDALAPKVELVTRAERRGRARDETRAAIAELGRILPASQLLDDLATRLPSSVSLERAEYDPRGALTLEITAADGDTVDAALDGDRFFRFIRVDETVQEDGGLRLTYKGRKR